MTNIVVFECHKDNRVCSLIKTAINIKMSHDNDKDLVNYFIEVLKIKED